MITLGQQSQVMILRVTRSLECQVIIQVTRFEFGTQGLGNLHQVLFDVKFRLGANDFDQTVVGLSFGMVLLRF